MQQSDQEAQNNIDKVEKVPDSGGGQVFCHLESEGSFAFLVFLRRGFILSRNQPDQSVLVGMIEDGLLALVNHYI